MKTDDQIKTEIETLKKMKPTVRKTSAFGDNHHDAIDCQIEVLEKRMTEEKVYDRNDGAAEDEAFHADNERDSGLDAARWLHDDKDEEEAPHKGWESLVK